jgi:hypothetical protein
VAGYLEVARKFAVSGSAHPCGVVREGAIAGGCCAQTGGSIRGGPREELIVPLKEVQRVYERTGERAVLGCLMIDQRSRAAGGSAAEVASPWVGCALADERTNTFHQASM